MIVYRTSYDLNITPFECEKASKDWISYSDHKGRRRRCARWSRFEKYFDTWEEARDFLLDRARKRLQSAHETIEDETKSINALLSMNGPIDTPPSTR